MIRWAISFCMLCSAAFGDPVSIRSGEHETFSRLVLSIGEDVAWRVSPLEDGYVLDLDGPVDGFETGTVFSRIPRNRLANVDQLDQGSLFLDVICECYVDAFLWRPGQLVLDIVEGLDPNEPIDVVREEADSAGSQQATTAEFPNLLALANQTSTTVSQLTVPVEFDEPDVPPQTTVIEEALLAGIARAASQGFLDPAVQDVSPPAPVVISEPQNEPTDLPGPPIADGRPGVGIASAIDRNLAFLGDALGAAIGQECLSADLFDLNSWGNGADFHVQVAALAEDLAGEFGEEPREAQDQLARLYLHFGFGAEARSVLSSDMAQSQDRRVLTELAGLIDDYPGEYGLIAAQAGCETPAAFWAFYTAPVQLEDSEKNYVLQQFFLLPQPLRGQLAPRLARKFVSIGDSGSAEKILRATENRDAGTTHDVQAARALIAEELEDPERALEVLAQEADDNVRTTPESLIRLVQLSLEQGQVPQESDLILVATMRQEYGDLPISQDLAIAEANGLIAIGEFKRALGLVATREDPAAQSTIDNAYLQISLDADAATFLDFAFRSIPSSVSAASRNKMARRLIDIGFPERALDLLEGSTNQEAAAERRYLRAEAYLENKNFMEAIDAVSGMTDERSRTLRSRAYTGLGEYRAALEASDNIENNDLLQFRAGAWERLTVESDEVLSNFATAVLSPSAEAEAETLADGRALITRSQESRRAVEGLLLRFNGQAAEQ